MVTNEKNILKTPFTFRPKKIYNSYAELPGARELQH